MRFRNDGDDMLRDAWVTIAADDTVYYPWAPELKDFIEMINHNSSQTASTNNTWSAAPVTLKDLDIDSAQEIVALNLYMDGVYSHPGARITYIRLGTLAPGAWVNLTYTMMCDKDMVNGKPYKIDVTWKGKDSSGQIGDPSPLTIAVRTSKAGTSYQAIEMDWFAVGMKVMGLILFIVIVLAVFIFVWKKMMAKKEEEYHPPQP